jgi:hypothetical protein
LIYNVGAGLQGAARAELRSALSRWHSAKAEGTTDLEALMHQMPSHLVASNRVLTVGETNYISIFANTRVSEGGTMFITSNGVVILLDSAGRLHVLQ